MHSKKRIHIIACGGAVMHNIALALHDMENQVSGSDDEIFEPAYSRLAKKGLLPNKIGWDENRISSDIDFIILGMHARIDNPELIKAQELGIKIYSFPDYVYQHAKDKIRVVVGGSHGKTSTTAMIMHVLKELKLEFDYLVGSQLDGFENMVKFSDAPIMIIEGDEYLTSPMDRVPKFLKYHPHYAAITGIAWDHINVFPTFENYVHQFELFANSILPDGTLIYFEDDEILKTIAKNIQIETIPYNTPNWENENDTVVINYENAKYPLQIFGEHNLQNLEAAKYLCSKIGIGYNQFYTSIKTFKGTAKRLEKVLDNEQMTIFRDFAHSPSKLKATVNAVCEQYKNAEILAVFELHTFSSLNIDFLDEYRNTMDEADEKLVYFNAHVFEMKKMQPIESKVIAEKFGNNIEVINNTQALIEKINNFKSNKNDKKRVLLLMSSGNFDNAKLW